MQYSPHPQQDRHKCGSNRDEIVISLLSPSCSSDDAYQCETDVGTASSRFVIYFTIEYPYGCSFLSCKRKFIVDVNSKIANFYENMDLTPIFADGEQRTLELTFCSLIPMNSSESYILYIMSSTSDLRRNVSQMLRIYPKFGSQLEDLVDIQNKM